MHGKKESYSGTKLQEQLSADVTMREKLLLQVVGKELKSQQKKQSRQYNQLFLALGL